MEERRRAKEEYVIVLDFLKHGYSADSRSFHRREPIVQAIGKDHFVLLELVPQSDIDLKPHDEVYIGEGERKEIAYIKGVLGPERLTQTAKNELPFIVEKLVETKEEKFIEFFNKCGAVSLRAHQLELLPGVGKKHTSEILKTREKESFTSFEDIKKRVKSVPNPKKLIIDRILKELDDGDRYKLFAGV